MKKNYEQVAYHEAGHAVASLIYRFKFRHVSIQENEARNSLGHIQLSKLKFNPEYDNSDNTRLKTEKFISICLAGPIAETKFTGKQNNIGASSDFEISFARASNLFGPIEIASAFMDFIQISTQFIFTFSSEDESEDTPAWDEVKILATELIKKKKLSYKQVREILPRY